MRGVSVIAIAVAITLCRSTMNAVDLDVTAQDIEAVLKIARGSDVERQRFHSPYVHTFNDTVERVEVITELRRLMVIAEERLAAGDRLFAFSMRPAEEALRPWRRRVAVAARLRFPLLNAYVTAPPVDIRLHGVSGEVPRLDGRSESLFALATGRPGEPLPVVGAAAEAVFDATVIGQRSYTVVVRMQGKDVAVRPIDFGRLQ